MKTLKDRKIIVLTLMLAIAGTGVAYALIWQYYCGQYIGQDIRNVIGDMKKEGYLVIHPRDQSTIDRNCGQLDRVVVLPKGLISKLTIHVSRECIVERVEIGLRK
jgi:hypothetical protein